MCPLTRPDRVLETQKPVALVTARDRHHNAVVMSRLFSQRLVRTVLAALFALAIGLPAVHAGEMAVKMASYSHGVDMALGDCTDCGGMDKSAGSGICMQSCPVPALGVVLTSVSPMAGPSSTVSFASDWVFAGRTPAPDPHPPRLNEIG